MEQLMVVVMVILKEFPMVVLMVIAMELSTGILTDLKLALRLEFSMVIK